MKKTKKGGRQKVTIKKNISLLILVLFISTFFMPLYAYASTGEVKEALKVNAAWIEDEMLQVDVTNINTGENQKLEVQLKDYTSDSEYVSVQAVDPDGNKSNIVQIKNPYYKAEESANKNENGKTDKTADKSENSKTDEAAKDSNKNAFTPAGTGEVMDNAKDGDGKEFFTIKTKNDNVFYLIVDRQRENDNVYLLNAVSESDLVALAEKGEDTSVSAVPETETKPEEQTEPAAETEEAKTSSDSGNNSSVFIFVFIAVLAAGGIGYYIKIYKPKHSDNSVSDDENFDGEDSEYEVNNDEDSEYEVNDGEFESEYEDNEGEFDIEKEFEEDIISDDEKNFEE